MKFVKKWGTNESALSMLYLPVLHTLQDWLVVVVTFIWELYWNIIWKFTGMPNKFDTHTLPELVGSLGDLLLGNLT